MSQTVWIARHGNRLDFVHPQWFNTAERPYDPPLSEDGIVQAKELGQRLIGKGIKHIFASPFLRTVQTANQVANRLELPIKIELGLSEWLNPEWMKVEPERLPTDLLQERFPRIDPSYLSCVVPRYPETNEQVLARTRQTAQQLTAAFSDDILLVGHGASVVGTTQGLVGGTPKVNASLCCLVKVVRQGEQWVMELNGDTSHLSQTENVIRFH
ncbi:MULTISPECIES: histidine phosphatase family protein [unclassified Coleofasciculus]|uniref:histidine phosphatase family protein n=1 Tax=unclassified Coleofasciculus TaxID=2692782 RepID=UPI00187F48A8|nr:MULTISPECIES: histidine phosphatase family protein [unclassified Coleofasciculus]MBE9129552.1 histidine phosphatase family protein [Coleofasciculus sp. LEGE 07081]MBE9149024.1 histidine phosphatase family protein [Coleofasciculus sp. LEGE 07092]